MNLIITTLRVRDDDLSHNAWYQVLKRDEFIPEIHWCRTPLKDCEQVDEYSIMIIKEKDYTIDVLELK